MSGISKMFLVFGCIALGYVMMFFGYSPDVPNWLGMSLFFGGAAIILIAGLYGLIKFIGRLKK